ncbi:Nucleolar protein 12 [Coemansia sp. RSA 2523]|nr:Nucleolar protein 12 [Coemansia sp. RSA 1824]KAJ1783223.1 Nucleolar protein 12 [Coemansia sp. RSA 1938]KAJ1784733.1 Nucleolar protein 12 [Coemansia sp. RSA 2167]KAJ1805607.1 Nucleolar protein 12 [Coemansia sp. RSA 2523]KAJ2147389.1 Nucleolar protein 12 [Coemansia sp. RSA 564]KAJ2156402.1 Nucleolar protein 12 [Coemansia sp. RSA 560]KAJ2169633.1 Nucleolar protein 12 [Coemansia sp. RSA 562]KAJ2182434.1 Nucleolar protein 12 [Coemansia sp. RSA 551]KAJ2277149.1 Nucleolar protein 12 [Coemansia 
MAETKQGEISQLLAGGSKKGAVIDSALDSLFANAPAPAPVKPVITQPLFAMPKEVPMEVDETPAKWDKKAKHPRKQGFNADSATTKYDKDAMAKQARRKRHGYADSDNDSDEEQARPSAKKEKKTLLGRMPQDPDAIKRTLFIGNLSIKSITDRDAHNELRALCKEYGVIKAIRFRSIAFAELLPRKLAFIRGKFHSDRQVCNAYVEYTEEESAKKALELNGTEFQDKHIRVDLANNDKEHDMKKSVFVGNLDFAAEEEDLWRHFGTCGTVSNVRIIRDSKTNLGKGFAYVQFSDRASVSLALKLNGTEVNSRKLRVQRASEQVPKGKKAVDAKAGSVTSVLEGTRSVKGDKPSNKKRRTARSRNFAENRLNTANSARASAKAPAAGAQRGRGKPRKRV